MKKVSMVVIIAIVAGGAIFAYLENQKAKKDLDVLRSAIQPVAPKKPKTKIIMSYDDCLGVPTGLDTKNFCQRVRGRLSSDVSKCLVNALNRANTYGGILSKDFVPEEGAVQKLACDIANGYSEERASWDDPSLKDPLSSLVADYINKGQ